MNKLFLLVILFIAAICVAQKCTTIEMVGIGEKCDYVPFPADRNVTYLCQVEGACQNSTTPTCVVSVAYNSACEGDGAVPCPHTRNLQCIHNKCTIANKIYGEPCKHDDECFSGMCKDGTCFAKSIGDNCTSDKDCILSAESGLYAYCDVNNTCSEYVAIGGACDGDFKCLPGQSQCINGKCVALAKAGEECGGADHPSCVSDAVCIDGKCVQHHSRGLLEECAPFSSPMATLCQPGLACNGTHCLPKDKVTCDDSNRGLRCKGFCKCNPDHIEGTCEEEAVNCPSQQAAFDKCVQEKCLQFTGGSVFDFAPEGCVQRHCESERKALYCCLADLTQYIPFREFDKSICVTPQPTPKPTPGKTPSSAAVTMINAFTIFVVIASLLL
jgi:hypothetical protein